MPSSSEDIDESEEGNPWDFLFILTADEHFNTRFRRYARKLDQQKETHYLYALIDSLSSGCSMFKWWFNIFISSANDMDLIHAVLMRPEVITALIAETLFLLVFASLATKFDKEEEEEGKEKEYYKLLIIQAWIYFRDMMKGSKNAYKGWQSFISVLTLLAGSDLKYLITPFGIVFALFVAGNRYWLCQMREQRKADMAENLKLKEEIRKLARLTSAERVGYSNRIKFQTYELRSNALVSVGLGGLLDSFYLYVGIFGLAALPLPVLTAMTSICAFYSVSCVINRVYEEYDFQTRLFITETKCHMELIAKELETQFDLLGSLQEAGNNEENITPLKSSISDLIDEFEENRKLLIQQSTDTYSTALLLGIKHGLCAYGALVSALFALSSCLMLMGVALPPVLLIITTLLGLVFIAGFIIHALVRTYNHLNEDRSKTTKFYERLLDLKEKMKLNGEPEELLETVDLLQALLEGLTVEASPTFCFQECFEVFRSLFSGISKGKNFAELAAFYFQDLNAQGHFHDTLFVCILAVYFAILFGKTMALRALAKGFGRTPPGQEKTQKAEADTPEPSLRDDDNAPESALEADSLDYSNHVLPEQRTCYISTPRPPDSNCISPASNIENHPCLKIAAREESCNTLHETAEEYYTPGEEYGICIPEYEAQEQENLKSQPNHPSSKSSLSSLSIFNTKSNKTQSNYATKTCDFIPEYTAQDLMSDRCTF